ncbi:Ribonuclease H1 [Neofusicoccum parvum]|uniref:Ribonuclease H1 n=1 Tax=Neofusicoccum parvum TaxID=310453 RepID=A0ACB5RUG0_9PEZI|nr:Ribonuclease H1 [Neofusicoccum parvum]
MATDEFGEPLRRLFDPALDRCTRGIPRPELVVYNEDKQVSQLQMTSASRPQPSRDASSVVIHIDGACRGNGTPAARASYGVYVGPDSRHNTSGLLEPSLPQTSTRAEIEALARALDVIHAITMSDFKLSQIKVATDSSFLVNAMAVWMDGWLANGGVSSRGGRVAHFERLRQLNERLDEMEYGDDGGIEVQFWHVPREMNREADALANTALGSA